MTGMLASVKNLEEARIVLAEGVDIIDLKNPEAGSLGALSIESIRQIVSEIGGQCLISATIGDLPMEAELIFDAVARIAQCEVNYVKIGFLPNGNTMQVIEKLQPIAIKNNLIAVLFADTHFDFSLIDQLIYSGFSGVMLDTLGKSKGSLTTILDKAKLGGFVAYVKSANKLCGLAGALNLDDIPHLLPYQAHYLGFRGALCEQQKRSGQINPVAVRQVKQTIVNFSS